MSGVAYARQKRVYNLSWDESLGILNARVQGTVKQPYTVTIKIKKQQEGVLLDAYCTCPLGFNCKHIVAALIEGLDRQFPMPIKAEPSQGSLDPSLTAWLNSLEDSQKELEPTYGKKLIYILAPSKGKEAFQVSPFSTTILKNGKFSSVRNIYTPENAISYDRPKFIQDIDLSVLRLLLILTGRRYTYDSFQIGQGQEGLLLLKLLIESERCYLETEDSPHHFLVFGEPKHATISWKIAPDGMQRVHMDVEGVPHPLFLDLHPLHYLCPQSSTVGILNTDLSHKQASAMLKAPPVNPRQAPVLAQKLGVALNLTIPDLLPASLPIHTTTESPMPCLTLKTVPLQPQKFTGWTSYPCGEPVLVSVGSFSFDYGGVGIFPQDSQPEITRFENGEVRVTSRDFSMEKGLLDSVPYLGFTLPLNDVERYYALSEEMATAWTFGEMKPEFHKDKTIPKQWEAFMEEALPRIRKKGWIIKIDRDFTYNVVKPDDEWYAEVEEGSENDWFGVELGVTIDGKRLNLIPILLDLLKNKEDIFKTITGLPAKKPLLVSLEDGRKLALPAERVRILLHTLQHLFSFRNHLGEEGQLKLKGLDAALLAEIESAASSLNMRWFGDQKNLELGKRLKNFTAIRSVPLPKAFHGELRPYQQDGLNWLQFLREYGLAGILADDMGLGKTVQVLAHIAIEKSEKRLKKPFLVIAPTSLMVNWKMEAERFVPGLKILMLHGPQRKQHFKTFKQYELILTTYPLLPRDKDALLAGDYHTVILDEAQLIKNSRAKITQIANQLKAAHRLCMTGTPMENHLGELWSLFHFLLPGYLGTLKQFGMLSQNLATLSNRIKPFVLRRTKQEVMAELPPKTEMVRMVELEGTQRDLYETIRISMHEKVRKEIAARGMDKSHIIVLDALLKLRQVCCDPALLKLDSAKHVTESAKRDELMALLIPMIEEGRKILLFSQFTSMLALIEKQVSHVGIPYAKLTGKTIDRETQIRRFQEGVVPLFLISLKAGGTGLNLTAADTVIHYDPWWNPAVENQATDRAYRIGQDKPVFVYKLITSGTVEEKIIEMQQKKHQIMESLFDPKEKSSGKLTARDIQTLFEPIAVK